MFFWNRWRKLGEEQERAIAIERSAQLVLQNTIEDLKTTIDQLCSDLEAANQCAATEATKQDRIRGRIRSYAPADLTLMSNRKLQAELELARDVINDIAAIVKGEE